jgi:aspartate/methionine/tyrosine aminotransferase
MPGESFGLGAAAGHVRVALTVEKEQLREACVRIRRLIEKLAG